MNGVGWIITAFLMTFQVTANAQSISKYSDSGMSQITFGAKNHALGIFDAWSPDDKWIVFSCGPNNTNDVIEKVNVESGEIITLYRIEGQTPYGPGCGTPSYCPSQNKVIFIHGPLKCGPEQKYEFWRRSAAVIEEPNYGRPVFLDARDVSPPFTPGALRGGTHCHEWSYDGQWVAFTYNDMIMAQLEESTGKVHDLRTIGVSINLRIVVVDKDPAGENFDGKWFSVILVEVKPNPSPGSDEISRAYENCWVGRNGYLDHQGKWQRAVAFKGNALTESGNLIPEVFIVDVPDKIDASQKDRPLEGTDRKMPFPPAGTGTRRLTHTSRRKYPGLSTDPRFWLRSSPEGDRIFFLARDDRGLNQVCYISPYGGKINQVTAHSTDVMSTPSISPDGEKICYICDNSIFVTQIDNGLTKRVFDKSEFSPSNPIWSNSGKKIAFNLKVVEDGQSYMQIFSIAEN